MNHVSITACGCLAMLIVAGIIAIAPGCKQRPPQNGTIERADNDSTIVRTTYENGRITYRLRTGSDGRKISEEFGYYFSPPSITRTNGGEFPDKDSIVQYGEEGRIVSTFTTIRPSDGSPWMSNGKGFHPDGSISVIVDSGRMTTYYPSGHLQFAQVLIGPNALRQTYYDSLGRVREEWENLDGRRHGRRQLFDDNGKMTVNETYSHGKLIRSN